MARTPNWAYIATPEGASLARTFGLARGILREGFEELDCGVIHRRLVSASGKETANLSQMKPGDDVVLMYDLFNAGIVYPVATLTLARPRQFIMDQYQQRYPLHPEGKCAALSRLDHTLAKRLFEPDYARDIQRGGAHLALVVDKEQGGVRPPPQRFVGKVFLRSSAIGEKRATKTIEPWEALTVWKDEQEGRFEKLHEFAVGMSCPRSADTIVPEVWDRLDGRSKQLLGTIADLGGIRDAKHMAVTYQTLAAYVLCGLVEYELSKFLAAAGRVLVNPEIAAPAGISIDTIRKVDQQLKRKGKDLKLFLAPEVPATAWEMSDLLSTVQDLRRDHWKHRFTTIRLVRNRIAHSYLITSAHLQTLHAAALGKDGLLQALYQ